MATLVERSPRRAARALRPASDGPRLMMGVQSMHSVSPHAHRESTMSHFARTPFRPPADRSARLLLADVLRGQVLGLVSYRGVASVLVAMMVIGRGLLTACLSRVKEGRIPAYAYFSAVRPTRSCQLTNAVSCQDSSRPTLNGGFQSMLLRNALFHIPDPAKPISRASNLSSVAPQASFRAEKKQHRRPTSVRMHDRRRSER